ncbi:MAG: DUF790 family protein [Gemmatimonadales bacterium]|nr:MAG: DUF790 family protein [Gemmatimonadales bacterium]
MLRRTHVAPFLSERDGELEVDFLKDPGNRIRPFLARLLKLMRRLEGRPRTLVVEGLRRQERRVRDARRLDGIARTLLSLARFRPPEGADRSPEVRRTLFRMRGADWPPVPGDERRPYETAALALNLPAEEVDRLLYADDPDALVMVRAPRLSPARLLRRYNLGLAQAVLLDAVEVRIEAGEGWRDIVRAVKLARLMHTLEPAGDNRYRMVLTGPAGPFVVRKQRYGARMARLVPALSWLRDWRLDARIAQGDRTLSFRLQPSPAITPGRGRPPRYDSRWEEDLARDFHEKIGPVRDGWSLTREDVPVAIAGEIFLPDFTLRHEDGREALVELVGFWTPEYLEGKVRKLRAAGLDHLVLVIFRGLATGRPEGEKGESFEEIAGELAGEIVWFTNKVRIGPVMEAVERVARPARD